MYLLLVGETDLGSQVAEDGVGRCTTVLCREALEAGNDSMLAHLMDRNFDLRRSMFGDAALGATNLQMIDLARSVGGEHKCTLATAAQISWTLTVPSVCDHTFQAHLTSCLMMQHHSVYSYRVSRR